MLPLHFAFLAELILCHLLLGSSVFCVVETQTASAEDGDTKNTVIVSDKNGGAR